MKEKWYPFFKTVSIKMRRQKSVWGTCILKGLSHLNIQLMKGPLEVFEYVFVHEMCHLIEANHSPAFWRTVAEFMPDYKKKREWLRIFMAIPSPPLFPEPTKIATFCFSKFMRSLTASTTRKAVSSINTMEGIP